MNIVVIGCHIIAWKLCANMKVVLIGERLSQRMNNKFKEINDLDLALGLILSLIQANRFLDGG